MLRTNRYRILESYNGLYVDNIIKCFCIDLFTAKEIVDALLLKNSGRPFSYKIEKIDDEFIKELDETKGYNFLSEKSFDYTDYFWWKHAIIE